MQRHRLAMTTLLVAAAAAFGAAGCDTAPTRDGSKAPEVNNPLVAARAKLDQGTYKIALQLRDGTVTGVVDTSAKVAETVRKGKSGQPVTERTIDKDVYTRTGSGKWRHFDLAAPPPTGGPEGDAGVSAPVDWQSVLQTVNQAKGVVGAGGNEYRGQLPLTTTAESFGLDGKEVAKLSDGKDAPIEATMDADGRLIRYWVSLPAVGNVPAHQVELKITNFGTAVSVKKPAAKDIG